MLNAAHAHILYILRARKMKLIQFAVFARFGFVGFSSMLFYQGTKTCNHLVTFVTARGTQLMLNTAHTEQSSRLTQLTQNTAHA